MTGGSHWTDEEDSRLLKLKEEGKSLTEMAEALNRSVGAINTRLVSTHGFRVRKEYKKKTVHYSVEGRRAWTEEENNSLIEWYAAGFSFTEIAEELKRNERSVYAQYNLLRKSGKELPEVPTMPLPVRVQSGDTPVEKEAELLQRVIATQKEHTETLKKLMSELLDVRQFVRQSAPNSILVKLNRVESLLRAGSTPLNQLGAGERLVMVIPDDGEFSTVVKSDRVIIKRIE